MYFYSPCGQTFRSRVQLNAFLESHPGSPSPSQFRWYPYSDFQDTSVSPGAKRRGQAVLSNQSDTKKRKLFDCKEEEEEEETEGVFKCQLNRFSSSPIRPQNRRHPEEVQAGSSPPPPPPPSQSGINFTAKSKEKLSGLIARAGNDVIKQQPKETLQEWFYLVRKEEAPSCFGVEELSMLITSWLCKHQRPGCLREAIHIRMLTDKLQNQTEVNGDERNTGPGVQTGRTERNEVYVFNKSLGEQFLVASGSCNRHCCVWDTSFCAGCSCNLCKGPVDTKQTWSFLMCGDCYHMSHLECALKANRAGVDKEAKLDVQYLCTSCSFKTDLVPFWKNRIEDAASAVARTVSEKHITAAIQVMDAVSYPLLHMRLKELASDADPHGSLQQLLDSLADNDDDEKLMDPSILAEILHEQQQVETTADPQSEVEAFQKQAVREHAEWLKAEEYAESQHQLLRQIGERLREAEAVAKSRARAAASSQMRVEKAQKKVNVLGMLKEAQQVSKSRLELQKWSFDRELSKLLALQDKAVSLTSETWDDHLSKLSALLETMKVQRQRVGSALVKLEQLSYLNKLLK